MGGTLVSVVVPVYKVKPEYLRQCVESILGQTYTEFEVVLVDDGSPDSCGQICDEYAAADPRVNVIHQENSGAAAARNAGMDTAVGEYLAFVDADDWLDAGYLKALFEALPGPADVVSCCCKVVLEDGNVDVDRFFDGNQLFIDETLDVAGYTVCPKEELFCQLLRNAYGQPQRAYTAIGVPWGKLYRVALLKGNGFRFQPGQKMREDNVLNMYAFNAAHAVAYLDEPLYNYRYEHMRGWSKAMGDEFADIHLVAARARVKAMEETGLCQNPRLQGFCDAEIAQSLVATLNNVVFRPGAGSFAQKRERADRLVKEHPYGEVVARSPKLPNAKGRLWMFLIQHRMWRVYWELTAVRNAKQRMVAR